ncbi:TPA: site-specific DNA-methyltransferase [Morganella morganii]|uniref:site-specific DNA-methyltransferase n=1 Tax=Morganella morganii TaxID=582 RepID=UPI0019CF91DC|nr:site-specific DNA-methyltransferase [Morganella morganii]WHZ53694.1 site-specific DNA-methyltransferase [Morganella morganii]HBU8230832.1 site-specific DNA-methyltransferase [Morganella morganii]
MTGKPEVMSGESLDIAAQRRDELKQLFPGVFTETKDADGNLVSSIDFERLKAELGTFSDIYEGRRERYGMEWPGKRDCMKVIQEPSRATLKPCPDESVDWDTTKNLFIEGDNLEVLKLLQKSYYGKVKMIYIDPPYNTGHEFIYPDNYQETLDTYLAYAGLLDDEGKKFTTNTASEGRYHTKWLNMMFPRLFLARNLLKQDGVIFISIDDNELDSLLKLCNEVFGEESHVATFIWKSRQNVDNRTQNGASVDHEYIVCYGKRIRGRERNISQYSNPDNDSRGPWASANMVGLATADRRPNLHYDLINPLTEINYGCPDMGWRYDKNTMSKLISEERILWPQSETGRPRRKAFLNEISSTYTGFSTILGKDIYTRNGTKDVQELFGFRAMDFPKPVDLIKEILEQGLESGDICLDFFAGSATTCEAVYRMSVERGENYHFIAVQLPEKCDETTEAYKAGLKTISELSIERIKRSGKQIKASISDALTTDGVGIDLGVRKFSLKSSCFKSWNSGTVDNEVQLQGLLDLSVDNIVDGVTQQELLFEILIKAGFEPTESVESINLNGKIVFSVANRALLICLEHELTAELIDAVIALEPMQFICLDKGFQGNDQLKTNTAQAFKARSQDSEAEMVFKVV